VHHTLGLSPGAIVFAGICFWIFLLSLISSNSVTKVKPSLIIIYAVRIIVDASLTILLATTFLKSSRWVSVTLNLVSRLVDRFELNKYIRTVHSLFVVDLVFLTVLTFTVSALLISLDTFPLSYLPPRSLTSDSALASFEGEECTVPSLGQCTVRLYQSS
jgi:hypothetical protein